MRKGNLTFFMLATIVLLAFFACTQPTTTTPTDPSAGVAKRDMVSIPGGKYTQTDGTDSFLHQISSFTMAKYEVTYELWYTVYQWAINNSYTFANAGREGNDGTIGAAPTAAKYEPVTTVNWRDAMVWCNAYSQMAGLTPVYYTDGTRTTVIKKSKNFDDPECDGAVPNWSANGYRLPTEGEWQFVASNKGGTPYNYASGATANNETETQKVAWYSANSGGSTKDVGTTTNSSALTLYDVSGNVFEWCWDWYGLYRGDTMDYRGPLAGMSRMVRGGAWSVSADFLQVGRRDRSLSNSPPTSSFGFRLARTN